MISNTYCERPFTHINAHANGHYRLCCHATPHPNILKYTTQNTPPFEYFLSDEMNQIRSAMLAGERIEGCEFCYRMEDAGFASERLTNRLFTDVEPHSVSVQVRIFGNACNLSCYMCFPFNSTTRNKEIKSLDTDLFETFDSNFYRREIEVSTQDILENIDLIDFITIIGGEPFVMKPHWEFLDKIPDDKKKHIEIRYQTNLFKLHHMKWDIRNYLDKFKKIVLSVSADHFGEKLAWIRYPIDVDEFENNLMEFHEYIKEIHVATSILNVHDSIEIMNYYKDNFSINVLFNNVVQTPKALSIRQLEDKDAVVKILSKITNLEETFFYELQKPKIDAEYKKFVSYIKQLDLKRGTNANEVFGWQIYE